MGNLLLIEKNPIQIDISLLEKDPQQIAMAKNVLREIFNNK